MKDQLKAIYTQIKSTTGIKWIDEDYGQIDNYQDRPPVKFPCALVSIDQKHESDGGGSYDVTSTITVRVAQDRFADRTPNATEADFAITLAKMIPAEAVRDKLDGYSNTTNCGKLYLTGFTSERRTDGISVKVIILTETHEEAK